MKTMTVNLKGFKFSAYQFKEDIINNWRLILLFLMFLSGVLLGAVTFKNFDESITGILQNKLPEMLEYSFSKLFFMILAASLIPLLICFINSFSALGLPMILIIPLLCGFGISLISSYFYSAYKVDGAIFSILLILPAAIINTLMLLICSNESLILSGIISRNVFSVSKEGRGKLKSFFARYLVGAVIIDLTCLVDSGVIYAIGKNLLF